MKYYDRFVILIWILIGIIFWLQYITPTSIIEGGLIALGIVLIAYPFTTYLSKTLLQKAMQKRKMLAFVVQFFFISGIIAVFIVFLFELFSVLEAKDIFHKSELFVEEYSLIRDYVVALLISIFLNFGFCGLRFFEQNLKLQNELLESRLQILQAQINPHFMFNVLNHVHVLIKKEPYLADSLLLQYTDILRYQLYNGKKDYISIEQEIQFLNSFINVEKVRWKNKLDINCTLKAENNKLELPRLLLITFIENAFKHVSRSNAEKGYVNVDFEQKNNTIKLEVQNSKSAIKVTPKEDSGIGLVNIKRRLDILFPGKYSLVIDNTDTVYSIKLIINI